LNVITGKLYVSHYEKDIDSYNTIKDLLNNKRSIVINMLGSECKWDWRYKEIDNGGHAFFIMAIEEEEEMFECMDPYYDIEYGELRLQEFDKGCQDFYCINYTESNYMLDDKDALIRTLIHCKFRLNGLPISLETDCRFRSIGLSVLLQRSVN